MQLDANMITLPEYVTSRKISFRGGVAFEFQHKRLGDLGRIYIEGIDDKNSIVKSEAITSHKDDPDGPLRLSIFQKIAEKINDTMASMVGSGQVPSGYREKVHSNESEVIESKICFCRRCEKPHFNIVFSPQAFLQADFINVKRKLYEQILRMQIDSYVLGQEGRPGEHHVYKIWPIERDLGLMNAENFNKMTGEYCKRCR